MGAGEKGLVPTLAALVKPSDERNIVDEPEMSGTRDQWPTSLAKLNKRCFMLQVFLSQAEAYH